MTEKEKMLAGKPYLAFEEQLLNERQHAKGLVYEINTLHPFHLEERHELLKQLLGKIGDNFYVEPPFRCDYGYNIEIGENFYSNYNCTILDCAKVTIGKNVLFAPMSAYLQRDIRLMRHCVHKNMNMPFRLRLEMMFGWVEILSLIQV